MKKSGPIPIEDRVASKETIAKKNRSLENLNPRPILTRILLASRMKLRTSWSSGKAYPENQQMRATSPPARILNGQLPPNRLVLKIKR